MGSGKGVLFEKGCYCLVRLRKSGTPVYLTSDNLGSGRYPISRISTGKDLDKSPLRSPMLDILPLSLPSPLHSGGIVIVGSGPTSVAGSQVPIEVRVSPGIGPREMS